MKNFLIILFILLVHVILFVGISYTYRKFEVPIDDISISISKKFENEIIVKFYTAYYKSLMLKNQLLELKANGIEDRNVITNLLKTTLIGDNDLFGVWTVWEKNKFDGKDNLYKNSKPYHDNTGRFIPYWNRGKGYNTLALEPCVDYDAEGKQGYYYLKPKETKSFYITEPTTYNITGSKITVVSYCMPIIKDTTFYGVVGIDHSLDFLQDIINDIMKGDVGYSFIVDENGKIWIYPRKDFNGVQLSKLNPKLEEVEKKLLERKLFVTNISELKNRERVMRYVYQPIILEKNCLFFVTAIPEDIVTDRYNKFRISLAAILVFSFILILIIKRY